MTNELSLYRQLTDLALKIDQAITDEDRHRLADKAEVICLQLEIPIPDRALLGQRIGPCPLEV